MRVSLDLSATKSSLVLNLQLNLRPDVHLELLMHPVREDI
jgi:hypothetical protein